MSLILVRFIHKGLILITIKNQPHWLKSQPYLHLILTTKNYQDLPFIRCKFYGSDFVDLLRYNPDNFICYVLSDNRGTD